jgi:hypothetical protein
VLCVWNYLTLGVAARCPLLLDQSSNEGRSKLARISLQEDLSPNLGLVFRFEHHGTCQRCGAFPLSLEIFRSLPGC